MSPPLRAARLAACAMGAALSGCVHRRPPPPAPPPLKYVLESAWQAAPGLWFYPHEHFAYEATGIATLQPADHPALTTDNEPYDPGILVGAMQAVQLPAVAYVTNLETGLSLTLRVNDRGPANPGRLIALTPRAALLLGMTGPAAQVRVSFDQQASTALARQLQGHAADLPIATAPRGAVEQASLAPLAGTTTSAQRGVARLDVAAAPELVDAAPVPLRLPERRTQSTPTPGSIMIDAASFGHLSAARIMAADLAGTGATIRTTGSGRQTVFTLRAGPFASLADADATLARMLAQGLTEARIVIDQP